MPSLFAVFIGVDATWDVGETSNQDQRYRYDTGLVRWVS